MRNLKKILAMALTVLMVVGSFAMTATASFDDVTDYQEAIEVMAALGIASGKSESEFAPDDDVTREEMALWIAKIMTGKVAADYVTNNFLGAVENLTAFADLDEDNYVGAINYATNNGIIVGTSATTFEPAEAIKIQDVFAMVVRMLGYGSTAMNNNYPWSFIDKAISLGLDADLPADYANEAIASRGETMQILYNALTALKSDGSTLGYDFFGLEKATVVITGTSAGNAYTGADLVTKTVDGEDFVSFSILNANGTVASDKATYYALKSAFGIEGEAKFSVGNSYVVRTVDGFNTFLTCEAIGYEVVDQAVVVGGTSSSSTQKFVTIDGTKYRLANANSAVVNDGIEEIIVLLPNGKRTEVYDAASYVMDADLNILAEDGSILLYWTTTHGIGNGLPEYANLNGMYLYKLADGNFIQPNDYIWSLAKKVSINLSTAYGFEAADNSYADIEQYDAYSETVLYDDDFDGDYDRAIYFQYKFGKAGYANWYSGATNYPYLTMNGANVDPRAKTTSNPNYNTGITYYNADGEKISYADIAGKYVLYTYNTLYKTMVIKEIFEGQTGLVTGVDLVNNTITLNAFGANIITGVVTGESYKIGNAKLYGAEAKTIKALDTDYNALTNIIGKNINFIEKDGMILAIYNAVDDAKHMVFVSNNAGYTTMGYNNIVAYYNAASSKIAATQTVITVNAVNNYWYSGLFNNTVNVASFTKGDLLTATKDALGNYDVTKVTADALSADTKYVAGAANAEIVIENGVVYSDDVDFTTFKATDATVWIVLDAQGNFKTYTGIPASGSAIKLNANSEVFYQTNAKENFIYVKNGEFSYNADLGAIVNPWGGNVQDTTIVYVDVDTIATMKADNALTYGAGMLTGVYYYYDKAIDVINGGFVNALYTDFNFGVLKAGSFYLVQNGRVVKEIEVGTAIKVGKLTEIAKNDYDVVVYANSAKKVDATPVIDEANAFPIVYWNKAANNTWNTSSNAALVDLMIDKGANTSTKATSAAVIAAINDDAADGDDYVEVYYYDSSVAVEGYTFAASKKMPVFIVKNIAGTADGTLAIPADSTTEAPVNYTVEFKAFNFKPATLENKVGFYKTSSNGAHVDFAGKIVLDDSAKAQETVALQKVVTTTAYGASKGTSTTVETPATYVLAVARSVTENWNVYLTTAKKDIDGAIDSEGYAIEIVKTAYDLTTDSDLYFFEVSADMAVVDAADAAQSTVYVNINAVKKN